MTPMPAETVEIPRVPDLFAPTLKALDALGGSASNDEIDDRVADVLALSPEVRAYVHKEGPLPKVNYRCAWARSWLKNAGLVENSGRGVWALTAEGRAALARGDDAGLVKRVRQASYALRKGAAVSEDAAPPTEQDASTADNPEVGWRERLLKALGDMHPSAFERLCQRLLREAGFTRVEVTGKTGDGGIDGTGVLRMNLLSFQVIFQCKRWRGSVGASTVRDFRGAMVGRADKGLILTTGAFTADAAAKPPATAPLPSTWWTARPSASSSSSIKSASPLGWSRRLLSTQTRSPASDLRPSRTEHRSGNRRSSREVNPDLGRSPAPCFCLDTLSNVAV